MAALLACIHWTSQLISLNRIRITFGQILCGCLSPECHAPGFTMHFSPKIYGFPSLRTGAMSGFGHMPEGKFWGTYICAHGCMVSTYMGWELRCEFPSGEGWGEGKRRGCSCIIDPWKKGTVASDVWFEVWTRRPFLKLEEYPDNAHFCSGQLASLWLALS